MRFFYFTLIVAFFMSTPALWADLKALCPSQTFSSGSIEGIFVANECGDHCWATIQLDNGERLDMQCNEDQAAEFFGEPGNRVKVEYTVEQFWDLSSEEGYCYRGEVVQSGKILASGGSSQTPRTSDNSSSGNESGIGHLNFAIVDRSGTIRNPLGSLTIDKLTTACFDSSNISRRTWEKAGDLFIFRLTIDDPVTKQSSTQTYCFKPVQSNAVLTRVIMGYYDMTNTDELIYLVNRLLVTCAPKLE